MTKTAKLLLAGLVLAALAAGLWQWRDQQLRRRAERREAWMGYLRGPLSDLLYGSSRGRDLLNQAQRRPLNKAQREELAASVSSVRGAWVALRADSLGLGRDAFFADLKRGLQWHEALADLARDWPRLADRKDLLSEALEAEKGLRHSLAGVLGVQRDRMIVALKLDQDAVLEMNALIWALKE